MLPWLQCLRWALAPWIVAHLCVGLSIFAVWRYLGYIPQTGSAPDAGGLFAWDGGWYRDIALHGYSDVGTHYVRFFPLLPMIGRAAAAVGGAMGMSRKVAAGGGMIAVTSVTGYLYAAGVVRLAGRELTDARAARWAGWFAMLLPGAGVLALVYTEPLSGLFAVGFFLAVRDDRPALIWLWGLLSGLARPNGLFLSAVGAVLLLGWLHASQHGWTPRASGQRTRRRTGQRTRQRAGQRPDRLPTIGAALLAPVVGTLLYMGWCGWRFGDPFLPYATQTGGRQRGGIMTNPVSAVLSTAEGGLPPPVTVAIAVAAVVMTVLCWRQLGAFYGLWCALTVLAAVTSIHAHSLARYVSALFPFALVLATLLRSSRWRLAGLAACGAAFLAVAGIGFTPSYVL